jgi:hypothetical protein
MLKALGSRLTYANVMATVAVFLALGGGAYALSGIPDRSGVFHGCVSNSTGVLRIVRRASSCHKAVRRGKHRSPGEFAVSWSQQGRPGIQGNPGQNGQQGQQGTTGPPGVSGYQFVFFGGFVQPTDTSGSFNVPCPAGKKVLGGGASTFNNNIQVTASSPDDSTTSYFVNVTPKTGTQFGGTGQSAVNVRVVCANVTT